MSHEVCNAVGFVGLTPVQARVKQAITQHYGDHGKAPRYEELMRACEFASKSSVFSAIRSLEERGHISVDRLNGRFVRIYPVFHVPGDAA